MRALTIFIIAFLAFARAHCGEQPPVDAWSSQAGMTEELGAEELELRDELIAAHLGYMSALEATLAEIGERDAKHPSLPLLWARAEYLLETSYRLLENTGEHEAFLKSTAALKPEAVTEASEAGLDAPADSGADGGLVYKDGDGRVLTPRLVDGTLRLFDAASQPAAGDHIVARPGRPEAAPEDSYIQLVKARAAWLRGLALERLGKTGEAADEVAGLGLIRDWLILGPLESESEAFSYINFDLSLVYESMDASTTHPGKDGPVKWKPFRSVDPLGRFYPGALFRSVGVKAAYALALVYSPVNCEAVMRFGSDSPVTVCVNHIRAVQAQSAGFPDPDQEAFSVWLRRGWNTVLVRTTSNSGKWGVAARLTLPGGKPFPGYVFRPDADNLADVLAVARTSARRSILERFFQAAEPVDMGGATVLSEWLELQPFDARANFYLASLLVARRVMEGAERFDRELVFRRATEYSGGNPFFTLMAARSVDLGIEGPDREENLRLVLLKSVADQGSAAALVDMGRLYLDIMRQPRRADEYAELALRENPLSLRAGVLDYDVAVAMKWDAVAKSLLDRLAKRHPAASAARLRLGRAFLAEGRHRQALGEFHAILGVDAANAEALDGAVVALGMLGQTSAAVDLLVGHIGRFPYDTDARLKLTELYRTLGRDEEALAVIDSVLELAPDDGAALAMRRDIDRETFAEGRAGEGGTALAERRRLRQELDLSPPAQSPPNGWEYLYFQVEDRMEKNGSIDRTVSFALKIYTERAARMLRHLGFWLERDFESGSVTMLDLIQPNGARDSLVPQPEQAGESGSLKFYLPPLRIGMAVEAEVSIRRERIPFLGDYFGQIAPMTQQAPVRLSRYMFISPRERRVFFRPVNGAPEAMVVESPDRDEVTRIWEMSDLPAFIPEPDSPGRHELMPCIQVSSFGDWDEFARWYWRLIGAQYHTPPELRILAATVGGNESLPMVKLDRAAEWVARNIGHREWSYGPYAFRPINARSVLSRLSADGKDRTLFLCLLAREYGLDAWPVLARLRNRRFAPAGTDDLALPLLDHFNHSLVMVESRLGGDIFLDASNPYRNPGVMPSQLFGSPGMAITTAAAERVIIPDGGTAACVWDETASMVVDEDGSILWEQEIQGAGTAAETLRSRFRNADSRTDAWSSFLASLGAEPSAVWNDFREDPGAPASASHSGRARLRRMASVDEDRVALTVPALPGAAVPGSAAFAYPLALEDLAGQGVREQDLVLPHGFSVTRRINISYPEEWRLVNEHRSFSKEYNFGSVSLISESTPGMLILHFKIEIPGHDLSAADYPDFRELSALAGRWIRPLLVWEKP